jgi:hypothetical protein
MDYAEKLIRQWAAEDGLDVFYINDPFGAHGDIERLWYYSQAGHVLPGHSCICDLEAIGLFAQYHEYTEENDRLVNEALFGS